MEHLLVAVIHHRIDSLCCSLFVTMQRPLIETSIQEERRAYVREKWECMHNCELCGKCHILRGRDAETLYADYIEGRRSYMDVTLEIRK